MAMTVCVAALLSVFTGFVVSVPDGFKSFDCSDVYNSGKRASGIYSIYPAGDVPVWVYCHMMTDGKAEDNGGWMVIQRRIDGRVNFYRPWKEYKRGFGNVGGEYWLGLENMHQLTRNRKYMLRVDMEDFKGRKGFALYSSFSVDSETNGYKLQVSGFKDGGAGNSLAFHSGQKFTTYDKDQDSYGLSNCAKESRGGFWYNICHHANPNGPWGENIPNGIGWYRWKNSFNVNLKCISMKIKYKPVDCSDVYKSGQMFSGIYSIYPMGDIPVLVYCHMISDGKAEDNGGWTVIQRRIDGRVSFYQPWNEYKKGFGNVEGEYWLGLENMHQLTRNRKYMLRVDMEDFQGRKGFALYSYFSVDSETNGYKLQVSGFKDGGAGNSLAFHSGQKFTTYDKDQDSYTLANCAKESHGGFWYNICHHANPNGPWGENMPNGIGWYRWKNSFNVNLKCISMKIKHVF